MKFPTLISGFYQWASRSTPGPWKSTVRGIYNSFTKIFLYGTTDMFAAVDIETTSECNIKCPYCPAAGKHDRGNHLMDESLFLKIIDELATIPYRGRLSPHFYGEPLLDPRLPRLLAYARQKLPAADIIVHTNGLTLDRKLFRTLLASGVNGLVITLHNQPIREKMAKFLPLLSADERRKIRIMDISQTYLFNRGGLIKPTREKRLRRCFYIRDEIAITYQGAVVCTNDYLARHSFGNVSQGSLLDIWNKSDFRRVRHDLLRGKFTLALCCHCMN